jgi:hypothetical protein
MYSVLSITRGELKEIYPMSTASKYVSVAHLNTVSPLQERSRTDVLASLEELQGITGDETVTDGLTLVQLVNLHERLSDELQAQLANA